MRKQLEQKEKRLQEVEGSIQDLHQKVQEAQKELGTELHNHLSAAEKQELADLTPRVKQLQVCLKGIALLHQDQCTTLLVSLMHSRKLQVGMPQTCTIVCLQHQMPPATEVNASSRWTSCFKLHFASFTSSTPTLSVDHQAAACAAAEYAGPVCKMKEHLQANCSHVLVTRDQALCRAIAVMSSVCPTKLRLVHPTQMCNCTLH